MEPATANRASLRATADRTSRRVVCAALLASPAAIAFATGGVRGDARAVLAVAAWALVALAALTWRRPPLPRGRAGWVAVVALAALAGLVAVSSSWAALQGPAFDDRVRLAGYVAVFLLACAAWPSRAALRAVEPALAVGTVVVIGYGLAGRLLPDLVELDRSFGAGDLLEQPITYWNAMGAVAAVGIALCARLAGDRTRSMAVAGAACGAAAPLGAGLYLTGSRGAAAALAVGLAVLWLLAPQRRQLAGMAVVLGGAALGAATVAALPAVRAPGGDPSSAQGLAALAALVAVAAATAFIHRRLMSGAARAANGGSAPPAALGTVAVAVLVGATVLVAAGPSGPSGVTGAPRDSASGNRSDYWSVAFDAFAGEPVTGVGSGSFAVEWARERPIEQSVRDAHSLYLETGAELGLAGLLILVVFLGAVGLAARRAHGRDPALVAGMCAALALLAAHAAVDWDWEVPAVALIALVLAGALVAAAPAPSASVRRAD